MKRVEYYTNQIASLTDRLEIAQKKYQFFSFLRLLFFSVLVLMTFLFWYSSLLIPVILFCFILFLFAVSRSVDAKYRRDKFLILIEINKNEIEVLKGDWLMFDEGNEFKDSKHPFSNDLDVFGSKSVFQLLNRTVSIEGKNKLAHALMYGTNSIELNNKAINELSANIEWCQEFMSEGVVLKKEKGHPKSLDKLKELIVFIPKGLKFFRYILPIVAFFSTSLFLLGIINGVVFSALFVLLMLPIAINIKSTNLLAIHVMDQSTRVKIIVKQLEHFRELKLKDELLVARQNEFFNSNESVLAAFSELDKITKRFEFRLNFLISVLLNFFLSWDFQLTYQMNNWLNKNQSKLQDWEDKLADLEVWISGAVFQFNHEDTTFPIFTESNDIEVKGIAHPFVDSKKKVKNDVSFHENENFLIITGPNMAGKSTYLRSLGLLFVFSNAGFPVLADYCKIPKMKLYSSMRTSDDLTVESSYFHAELMRLRFIVDAIEQGEKVFVILDEILKGTNSKDKEIGSTKFLQKLTSLNSKGVIATHDLSLCKLTNESSVYKNMYFDSTIVDDELHFSYTINEGICQNMNASFLLKKMNLVD